MDLVWEVLNWLHDETTSASTDTTTRLRPTDWHGSGDNGAVVEEDISYRTLFFNGTGVVSVTTAVVIVMAISAAFASLLIIPLTYAILRDGGGGQNDGRGYSYLPPSMRASLDYFVSTMSSALEGAFGDRDEDRYVYYYQNTEFRRRNFNKCVTLANDLSYQGYEVGKLRDECWRAFKT